MDTMQYLTQPDIKDNFVVTLNKMGYMFIKPEKYMQAFIDYAAQTHDPVLDIGAAYGIATIPALEKGAYVVANDMDQRHLDILKSKVPSALQNHLELKVGAMPHDINFPEHYFGVILASRILNFVDPKVLKLCFSLIYKWLKPGCRFVYLGATPYMGTFRHFLPQYLKNKQEGCEWPGLLEDIMAHAPADKAQNLPEFINLIDKDLLNVLLTESGFVIETMDYIPAEKEHPEDMKLDGREHLGAIAIKPE